MAKAKPQPTKAERPKQQPTKGQAVKGKKPPKTAKNQAKTMEQTLPDKATPTAQTLSASQLGLQRKNLPHSIVEVIATLSRAGYSAYIVGGGVRDSLLKLTPKDFDAVTDATPSQIKDVFGGRCRIIGRRFQLAHVYSGREMVEVATFRADPKDGMNTTSDGMIVRDNAWGTIAEDFVRRDFSINALYYEPIQDTVQDFCGAIQDIQHRRLRLLGNPKTRIEEDPVRLLRALRFKAKLGFDFDKSLAKQFHKDNWALLEQVSAHRLHDETQKMFTGGYLATLLPLLYQHGAMPSLLSYAGDTPSAFALHVAKNTDERIAGGLGANPAFFYAVLLWDNYLHQLQKLKKKLPFYEAKVKAAARTIERQRQKTAIPRFAEEFISDIWLMQTKLTAPKAAEVESLYQHPRFRAGYDFLVARELSDDCPLSEPTDGMGAWWTEYQLYDDKARTTLMASLKGTRRRRGKEMDKNTTRKTDKQKTAELRQLLQLSLGQQAAHKTAKPLFDNEGQTDTHIPKRVRTPSTPPPSFASVSYSDADFMQLLHDEPFIPARRRHRVFSATPATTATSKPRTRRKRKPANV